MGLVMTLYVAMIVSFYFPHVVDVIALSICIVLRAFVVVISMCLLYVSLGSRVSPSIFGLMFMGSHQHGQHRNTTSKNTHKTLQGHHHSQHIHSTKKHHDTTPRYHRHNKLHTIHHQLT